MAVDALSLDWDAWKAALREEAGRLGIGKVGFTDATPAATLAQYEAWIEAGYHGEMGYLGREDRLARRRDLSVILPSVQSLIFVTLPYWPQAFPKEQAESLRGVVSCYAWGEDYHTLLGEKLKALCGWIEEKLSCSTKYFVDTGAIQERDLGQRAGLGFVGKNTMLIDPRGGSGFFIGEILCTLPIPPDEPKAMPSCGRCQRCLEACPTAALIAPYVMDARRCISYLTIELKGSIPEDLRPLMGNLIYGCDICQQCCPWMRFVHRPEGEGQGEELAAWQSASPLWGSPPEEVTVPRLLELMALDEVGFQERFRHSPIRRIKRARLLRNVAVALGNAGDPIALPLLEQATHDVEPLIREHAAWAIRQIQQKQDARQD